MDLILNIFKRLELDATIFYQFATTMIIFVVLNQVFFKKLLEVLKTREGNTQGLDNEANEKIKKADQMAQQYKAKIDEAFSESQEQLKNKKKNVQDSHTKEVAAFTKQKNNEAEEEFESFKKSFEGKRDSIVLKADELSKDLVNKLVQ